MREINTDRRIRKIEAEARKNIFLLKKYVIGKTSKQIKNVKEKNGPNPAIAPSAIS
ncbi:hypothetical protein LBMAG27_07510 [Bacteroidota bacterium]|nr:hypothetical protein LBMAG27_07510 [Bacteroidota bacterium]